jgi:hypothetical protein
MNYSTADYSVIDNIDPSVVLGFCYILLVVLVIIYAVTVLRLAKQ